MEWVRSNINHIRTRTLGRFPRSVTGNRGLSQHPSRGPVCCRAVQGSHQVRRRSSMPCAGGALWAVALGGQTGVEITTTPRVLPPLYYIMTVPSISPAHPNPRHPRTCVRRSVVNSRYPPRTFPGLDHTARCTRHRRRK